MPYNLGEYQHGTDPYQPDTDRDGWSDGDESDLGTDPLDAGSYPSGTPSPTAYEDKDCDKIYSPSQGDRAINALIAAGPFNTAACVVVFTNCHAARNCGRV